MRKAIRGSIYLETSPGLQSVGIDRFVGNRKLVQPLRIRFLAVFALLFMANFGFSQSMDRVDIFLDSELAPFDQAIYIILSTAGLVDEEVTTLQAIDAAQKLFSRFRLPGDLRSPISAQMASYMLIESFGLSGGIMYQLFPGPWYGIREANHRGLFPGTRRSGQRLTPFDILYAVSRSAEARDGRK